MGALQSRAGCSDADTRDKRYTEKSQNLHRKIKQFYITYNVGTQSLETAGRALFELPFGVFVAVFLLISAAAHALIFNTEKINAVYNNDLSAGY
jgi:hypothetical protein